MNKTKTGVLVCNLGTPDEPTAKALKRYLAEFLWDPRVVEIPRPIWWLILHGIILRTRPKKSAELYKKIWTDQGSPLLVKSQYIVDGIQQQLGDNYLVTLGMRYGSPTIRQGLNTLRDAGVQKIHVLPLYPQNSATTTASTFDAISQSLKSWRNIPELLFVNSYAVNADYITALASSVINHWQQHGRGKKLIMSYHGIPQRNVDLGDPYFNQCQQTSSLLANALQLNSEQYQVVFQSRFGRAKWLQPYCVETLETLAKQGCKNVDIICPGFPADCLETLEEIAIRNTNLFRQAGGEQLNYIPALNDNPAHIKMLSNLISPNKKTLNQVLEYQIKTEDKTKEQEI